MSITLKWRNFNLNNQARTKIMESTLFTTLTVTEEASLSGGTYRKYRRAPRPTTPTTPAPTTPTPTPTPTPAPRPITITLNIPRIITQTAVNTNSGYVKGDLTQTAVNQIG